MIHFLIKSGHWYSELEFKENHIWCTFDSRSVLINLILGDSMCKRGKLKVWCDLGKETEYIPRVPSSIHTLKIYTVNVLNCLSVEHFICR